MILFPQIELKKPRLADFQKADLMYSGTHSLSLARLERPATPACSSE